MNMKKITAVTIAVSLMMLLGTSLAVASSISGYLDGGAQNQIYGWAWDSSSPDAPVEVRILVKKTSDNTVVLEETVMADQYREDLLTNSIGNGFHAFHLSIDWGSLENTDYIIEASSQGTPLHGFIYYNYKEGTYSLASDHNVVASGLTGSRITPLGTYKTTAYCPCRICCSGWGRRTSTGAVPAANHTIAVDPRVIPYGSKVLINGVVYTAEDCGSGVKGKHIDIFFESHKAARQYGVRNAEAYLVE